MSTCSWGGYAVCYHGYYRTTGDIDFWIAVSAENAARLVRLIREFGFEVPELSEELFLAKGRIIRMGVEPTRIGLLTEISGCDFADCYGRRLKANIDGNLWLLWQTQGLRCSDRRAQFREPAFCWRFRF